MLTHFIHNYTKKIKINGNNSQNFFFLFLSVIDLLKLMRWFHTKNPRLFMEDFQRNNKKLIRIKINDYNSNLYVFL
jgi:hypothetical protein